MRQIKICAHSILKVFRPIHPNFIFVLLQKYKMNREPIRLTVNPTTLYPKLPDPISIPPIPIATKIHRDNANIFIHVGISNIMDSKSFLRI